MIGDILQSGFVGIILLLDTLIFGLIQSAFKIFMALAGARLLSSDAYTAIANKIYIIVGVLALFILSYSILRAIIDPDQAMKNEFGPKTVKNIIVAVIGLAIAPVLFTYLYQAQGLILEHDVLAKLFFRMESNDLINVPGVDSEGNPTSTTTTINPDEYVKEIGGAVTAVSLWKAFFYPAGDKNPEDIEASFPEKLFETIGWAAACAGAVIGSLTIPVAGWLFAGAAVVTCMATVSDAYGAYQLFQNGGTTNLKEAYSLASSGEGFGIFTVFIDNYAEDEEIEYFWGISTVTGAFVLYAFVSFSIDMGVRAAKLAYLQIIAPIPLVLQVVPKFNDRLKKYIGIVTSTFMEVLVRISVIYVVVYIICHLSDMFSSETALWGNDTLNIAEKSLALALLILGLVAFCRSAPKFISESLGLNSGTMDGLGLRPADFRKKLADGGAFNAYSAVRSGAGSALQRWNSIKDKNERPNGKPYTNAWKSAAVFGAAAGGMARALAAGIGPERIDSLKKAKDAADNATNEAMDAARKRDALAKKHVQDLNRANQAETEYNDAKEAYDLALINGPGPGQTMADLEQKVNDARDKFVAARNEAAMSLPIVGQPISNTRDRWVAWSTGSIDTTESDEIIALLGEINDFKDKARAVTAKHAAVQAALKRKEEADQRTVSDYDEEAYADAVKNAMNYIQRDQFNILDAAGSVIGFDELAYNQALANAAGSVSKEQFKLTTEQKEKLRAEYRKQAKAAKDMYEAAQDLAFQSLLADGDDNALKALEDFRASSYPQLQKYGSHVIDEVAGTTIADMLSESMGYDVAKGELKETKIALNDNRVIEIERKDSSTGTIVKYEAIYDDATKKYKDLNGVFGSSGAEYDIETFQGKIMEICKNDEYSVAAKETGVVKASKKAKKARTAEMTSEERIKMLNMKRKIAETKKGNK